MNNSIFLMQSLIKYIITGLVSLSICIPCLHAQDSTGVTLWNLKTCIDYAKKNNISLNSQRLNSATGEQNLILSKYARYPNLNGSVSQGLTHYNSSGMSASSGYGINSSVTIYNGGYYKNDIKAKELSLQIANLDVSDAENNITLEITQAYLNILLAKENIEYVKDLVATSEAQVIQNEEKYKYGTIALKTLLQFQSDLATDKYTLVQAENTRQQNILTLKQLLQLPANVAFDVVAINEADTPKVIESLSAVQQTALQTFPEIKSGELGIRLQETELQKAKTGLKPTISLDGSLYSGYNSQNQYGYTKQLNNAFYQQAGVTLSIPIFDRRTTKTNVAKAKISIEQAKLDLQNSKTTLTQAVEQAYLNVKNAQSQYSAAEEQLKYTQESYRIGNEQLRIGVYNNVEYLQQKNLYVQAMQNFIQAKYTVILYTKIYNFYSGIPVTD